jgi:RimJ/RimL family protein N-acetyltransferase
MFEVIEQQIDTPALRMRYHLAPWDAATVGAPVAVISSLEVLDFAAAKLEFERFQSWYRGHEVALISCRLPHVRLTECGFLESYGFRFIELNYRPECAALAQMNLDDSAPYDVEPASPADESLIAEMAGQVFEASRFHHDPMIDPRIGHRRYQMWIHNAFRNPEQSILKCSGGGRIVAFFVVEAPQPQRRFWSLVGLAPGMGGRGVGASVWRAVMRWHRQEGVEHVSTSISSLNLRVHNLYVKLGFRFPAPDITLHCCPLGPIVAHE